MVNSESTKNLEIRLKLMNELEKNSKQSQRTISKELNIALGLANSLIKRFVSKGFLKLSQAPMKRYFYYLTPKGLVEKTKLTSEYFKSSFEFYNKIRTEYEKEFNKIKTSKPDMIILIGISEFTEIAILAAKITQVDITAIVHKNHDKNIFCGIPVQKDIKKFSSSNKNIFFLISSPFGVDEYVKILKHNNKTIKPNFLFFD